MAHRGAVDDEDHIGGVIERQPKAKQVLLVALLPRDVLGCAEVVAGSTGGFSNLAPAKRDPDHTTVLAAPLGLKASYRSVFAKKRPIPLPSLWVDVNLTSDVRNAGHHVFVRFVAEYFRKCRIGSNHTAIRIDPIDSLHRVLENRAVVVLCEPNGLGGAFLRGNVLQRAEPSPCALRLARRHRLHHLPDVDPFVMRTPQPIFDVTARGLRRSL